MQNRSEFGKKYSTVTAGRGPDGEINSWKFVIQWKTVLQVAETPYALMDFSRASGDLIAGIAIEAAMA
jgi:hypothetical protein